MQVNAVVARALHGTASQWHPLAAEAAAALGPLSKSVAAMLSPEPARRPALATVQRQWHATWKALQEEE